MLIEIPHFASLREKEREIQILRSDNGETWYEHPMMATEDAVAQAMAGTFEGGKPIDSMLSELPVLWFFLLGEFGSFSLDLQSFNPFPNKPWFLRVCSMRLLKTLWEKEKLPTCFDNFLPFSFNLKLSSANTFNLEESKICRLGKG